MIGEPVVIRRPAVTTDRYGNEVVDEDAPPAEFVLTHCAVAPTQVSEVNDGRTAVVSGFTIYASPDVASGFYGWSAYGQPLAAIWSTDRLVIRGEECEVVGHILDWVNPFDGQRKGVEVQARRAEG